MGSAHAVLRVDISDTGHRPDKGDAGEPNRELSHLERTVIAIGVADAAQGKRIVADPDARLERLIRLVAGRRTPARLADPRLEALRHFAQVAAADGERIANVRRLSAAGFSLGQVVAAARLSRAPGLPRVAADRPAEVEASRP